MQVIVKSLITNYLATGQGKTVVLIHGWADNLQTFGHLQKQLSQKYKVIALDLPGFGGTSAPPYTWGLNDYANFISEFIKKLGEENIFAYVGHSNGGAILINGLASGTLKAQKLVLIASAGVRNEYMFRKNVLKALAKAAKIPLYVMPKNISNKLRQKGYQAIGSDYLLTENLKDTFKKIVATDVTGDAAKIAIPVLLIYGSQDTSTPTKHGQKLAGVMANAKLQVIPGVGHHLHNQSPQQINNLVQGFLQ